MWIFKSQSTFCLLCIGISYMVLAAKPQAINLLSNTLLWQPRAKAGPVLYLPKLRSIEGHLLALQETISACCCHSSCHWHPLPICFCSDTGYWSWLGNFPPALCVSEGCLVEVGPHRLPVLRQTGRSQGPHLSHGTLRGQVVFLLQKVGHAAAVARMVVQRDSGAGVGTIRHSITDSRYAGLSLERLSPVHGVVKAVTDNLGASVSWWHSPTGSQALSVPHGQSSWNLSIIVKILGLVRQPFWISLGWNLQSLQRLPLSSLLHCAVSNPGPPAIRVRGWRGNLLQGAQNNRGHSNVTALRISSREIKPKKVNTKILQPALRITKKYVNTAKAVHQMGFCHTSL